MTKLFVIGARGNIVAISEKRKIAERFLEERSKTRPVLHKVTDKKTVNKMLADLQDYYIEEDLMLGILLTERESRTFMTDIYHEFHRITTTLRDMEYMMKKYQSPDDIQNHLEKGIKGLRKLSNPKTFGQVFGLETLINGFHSSYTPLDKYIN